MQRWLLTPMALVLSLAACTASRNDMHTDAHADEPLRKLNPNPQQAYRITLTIHDAPGPLVLTDARAQYDVTNETPCGKMKPQGGPYRMTSSEPLELTRIDETTYQGTVYLDQILDEDYYGKGVCHWQFTEVRAALTATGASKDTRFAPFLDADKVIAQQSEKRYFWNERYPSSDFEGYSDFGNPDIKHFKPELRDSLFSTTLRSEKVQP